MNMESQMSSAARHLRKELAHIPGQLLAYAKGIVFLTLVKGAFIWSGSLATGIVVKKLSAKKWSPPVSVGMAAFGFGLQAGGEKVDIIIIVGDDEEIAAFESTGQLKLGVSYGIAAGPVGRDIDISAYVGSRGLTCSMYYARSKGAYIGFALEGAVLLSRWSTNSSFYGKKVSVRDVLNNGVTIPPSKEAALEQFHTLLINVEEGKLTTRIGAGRSSDFARESSSEGQLVSSASHLGQEEEEALLLDLSSTSSAGLQGKNILRSSLESAHTSVVFIADHIVNEADPACRAYNIIGALKGDSGIILEGDLGSGLGGTLSDYVRVRVNHSGVERVGLVSKYVLKVI